MKATSRCGTCGAALNAAGLCPACLLNVGMATRTAQTTGSPAAQAAMARPEIGALFGQYRIARLLGRGGMGEVFEAEDTTTGRRVAVKVLNQALASDDDRRRFIREGRMAATISDPHVVYVFGSEEINGAPVIAMELADGGTLKDRIKKGEPLAPSEAVDDILQVIDGLDSAAKAGVLHRDIKPANCFVDRDGNVKVGDFGLSISTLGHMESQNLIAPGSLLGTPAFASPEQLRGSQLDVRSDIYSVGATLFFLLTGKPPFEADAIVALISAVLDKAPPSPRSLRPNIPHGLAKVVLKCLAKDPKERFANYDELRHALTPFCSTAPKPGTLGLRFIAGFVDSFFASLPGTVYALAAGVPVMTKLLGPDGVTFSRLALWLSFAVWMLLYYAFPESRWGASFGKWICGLRVVGPDKLTPSFARALLRTILFVFIAEWMQHLVMFLWHGREDVLRMMRGEVIHPVQFIGMIFWVVLFMTMRRRNGYAALHELASGTRVVAQASRKQARPASGAATLLSPQTASPATGVSPLRFIGPYVVLDDSRGDVVLARDEVLRRNVWIVKQAAGSPPLPPNRRDLARPGRLRWLNGVRSATESWDAFEAPEGCKLASIPEGLRKWSSVRFWLLDLAEEISAGMKDGALPPMAVENVFITAQGRAVLLDQELGVRASACLQRPAQAGTPNPALPDVQKFLGDVAEYALGKNPIGLPLDVPPFLKNLRERSLHAMEFVVANLTSFTEKLPEVTRRRRAGNIFLAPACVLMIGVFVTVAMYLAKMKGTDIDQQSQNDAVNMVGALSIYANAKDDGITNTCENMGSLIAARYADRINDSDFWKSNPAFMFMKHDLKARLRGAGEDAMKRYANPDPEKVKEAEKFLDQMTAMSKRGRDAVQPYIGFITIYIGLLLLAVFNLVCSIIGVTPGARLFGMAVVDQQGRKASRWRLVLRSLIAWSPVLLLPIIFAMIQPIVAANAPTLITIIAFLAVLWLAFVVQNITNPSRGLHDRAAGTWLVPR